MNTLTLQRPSGRIVDPVKDLVSAAREKFATDLSSDPSGFDAVSWDITGLKDRTTNSSNPRLYFTRHGSTDQAMPKVFAEVIKGWIILNRHSAGNMAGRVEAVRMLWEGIASRRRTKPDDFLWSQLSEEDLSQTELLMRTHWSDSTVYRKISMLLVFTRFLAARGISRPLYYTPQTPRIEDFSRHTIAGQEERRDRLPSNQGLNGLANIYRELATKPSDRLRAAALAILVVTGFRVGELLTLPLDCEVQEIRGGKERYGIRYYKEKARSGEKMFAVRWLTPVGAELARQAIRQLRKITRGPRARARVLEQTPQRVPIPGIHWAARLTSAEVARILGFACRVSVFAIASDRLPRHKDQRGFYYHAFELEAYLRSLRGELWTVNRRDGTFQMLSETLLIAFRNAFHPGRVTNQLLVEPLRISQISDFITGKDGTKSAFERFGIREPNGAFSSMTSHQFRHWLNYIADKGGLPVALQTRWLGREHAADTEAYRHATVDERLEWVKAGIRDGQLVGTKASVYFELLHTDREAYLEGEAQAVHFTAFGLCLHDFAVTPCPYHLNCVRGCPDYLRTRGSRSERQHLIQIEQATTRALTATKNLSAQGKADIAEPWVRHCEQTIAGVRKALAVDDQPGVNGSHCRPFVSATKSTD